MLFHYVAYTRELGVLKGRIEARDEVAAQEELTSQGYKPLRLGQARKVPSLEDLFPSLSQIGTGELVRACRQLATMLNSGGNLLRALEMLRSEGRNHRLGRILKSIQETLDDGGSLSSALTQHSRVFSPLFVSVVQVGEYTGQLGPALEQMADILEKEHEAKQKAMRTLMYPIAIIGLSLATLGVLMTVALPPLLRVFEQMGTEVPLMTRILMSLISGFRDNFMNILLGGSVAIALLGLLRRIPRVRYWMDGVQGQAPLIGTFTIAKELSQFSQTIAMLLEAGVSLAVALELSISGCKNLVLRRAFLDAEANMLSGHGLAEALQHHSILPTLFVQLVLIGEESNSLQRTMRDAADTYQKQLEQQLNSLLGMLEPVSTVAVGGIVGFIAFSMFVPIYSGMSAL